MIILEKKYQCEIKTAIFDFENDNLEDLPSELKTLDIGILSKKYFFVPNFFS